MEGYSEECLEEIFRKNIMLALQIRLQKARRQNRLALILCGVGLVFILLSSWLRRLWMEEGTVRDIVFFNLNIIATVPFWARWISSWSTAAKEEKPPLTSANGLIRSPFIGSRVFPMMIVPAGCRRTEPVRRI